jgi:predicted MFS family arabinose efflux permease
VDANHIIAVQSLIGAAMAIHQVILFASSGRDMSDRHKLISQGVFQSLYSAGIFAGPIVSGLIYRQSGNDFFVTFLSMAVVAFAGLVLTVALYKE